MDVGDWGPKCPRSNRLFVKFPPKLSYGNNTTSNITPNRLNVHICFSSPEAAVTGDCSHARLNVATSVTPSSHLPLLGTDSLDIIVIVLVNDMTIGGTGASHRKKIKLETWKKIFSNSTQKYIAVNQELKNI